MNRAFVYGDSLFETMRVHHGELLYASLHVNRLKYALNQLNIENDCIDEAWLLEQVKQHIGIKLNCRVRLCVWRDAEGFYLPKTNGFAFEMEVFDLPETKMQLARVGFYTANHKACTPLSTLKSGNALIYVLASQFAHQHSWDDAIILNEHGRICEATSSNVFIIKDGVYYTPPLSEGCVMGVKRSVYIHQLHSEGKKILEEPITINQLLQADGVYLSNVLHGIRRIKQIVAPSLD